MSSDGETGLHALPLESAAPSRELRPGYPDGYRDPEWDGTPAQFRDIVMPARMEALKQSLDSELAALGFPQMRWEWEWDAGSEPQPFTHRRSMTDEEAATFKAVLDRMSQEWSSVLPKLAPGSVLTYDMVLPPWRPYDVHPWTPMRNVIQQRSKCYTLPGGARVHVKPGCRC